MVNEETAHQNVTVENIVTAVKAEVLAPEMVAAIKAIVKEAIAEYHAQTRGK